MFSWVSSGRGEAGSSRLGVCNNNGVTTLSADLTDLVAMAAAHDASAFLAALARATEFGRFRAADVRSILAAGRGVRRPRGPGYALIVDLPSAGTGSLDDYAVGGAS